MVARFSESLLPAPCMNMAQLLEEQLVLVSVTVAPPTATMGQPSSMQFSNLTLQCCPWHTIGAPAPHSHLANTSDTCQML